MSNIKYFQSKHSLEKLNENSVHFLTLWVVADLETDVGAQMLKNALTYMVIDCDKLIAPEITPLSLSRNHLVDFELLSFLILKVRPCPTKTT